MGLSAPVARLVAHELGEKLDAPVACAWSLKNCGQVDVQSRARAWRTLAGKEATFDTDRASEIAGLS